MFSVQEYLTYDDLLLKPKYSEVKSRADVDLSVQLGDEFKFGTPITPANMSDISSDKMSDVFYQRNSLFIWNRFIPFTQQLSIARSYGVILYEKASDKHVNYIGFSVGVKDHDYDCVDQFVRAGVKILCVDVAHGDSLQCVKMCEYISDKYPHTLLIAGNVATASGAIRLWEAGADVVKAGVGSGSICLTRDTAGVGVPSMSMLQEIAAVKPKYEQEYGRKLSIIADGGIRKIGDFTKALCFADMVMVGSMFAGCDETPSKKVQLNGQTYVEYAGSSTHKNSRVEGVVGLVKPKGSAKNVLQNICEGIQSGCSYQGVRNLVDLKKNPEFVKITHSGSIESGIHDVTVI